MIVNLLFEHLKKRRKKRCAINSFLHLNSDKIIQNLNFHSQNI